MRKRAKIKKERTESTVTTSSTEEECKGGTTSGVTVSIYPGFAGLSQPFPGAIQRHSSMFPGPLEQILHHLIGALLLGRPDNLLPAALRSSCKKPANAKMRRA